MNHRTALQLITSLIIAAGTAAALSGCTRTAAQSQPPPPPTVTVAPVEERKLVEWEEFTGRTEPIESVEIRPRISGFVDEVRFQSGQLVKKNDVLFVIDPRWQKAAYDRAAADHEAARVHAQTAEREAKRTAELLAAKAISKEEAESRESRFLEAKAQLLAAEAALATTKLELEHTEVRAPIDGRVSRALITPGNYVSGVAGAAPVLTTLVSVESFYVYATIDENTLLKFYALLRNNKLMVNSQGKVPAQLQLADESNFPHEGFIESLDNRVDPTMGSILVRAIFPNPDHRILPGLFAKIRVPVSTERATLLISERGIGTDQNQKFVYTVSSTNTAEYRPIKLGPPIGDKRIVREGLKAGERVVVNGLQRIQPGAPVTPEAEAPAPAAAQGAIKTAQQ